MNIFPVLLQLRTKESREIFSSIYFKASGLPIPESYLHHPNNRVFGVYKKQELIGGYILGNNSNFRTIALFAQEEKHDMLYEQLESKGVFTEICCFWIKKEVRTQTHFNFFIWLTMAYALRRYGTPYVLFGTCSRSLAQLYSSTSRVKFLSEDVIKRKSTFIFWSKQRYAVSGISEIVFHKLKRVLKIAKKPKALINI
ncbi:MAG: hypothetical protein ACRBG0_01165 [Lewinella sp.]|uniref:hypothetical protein n=1 Tax=Lewinella sp. TaxID=2004506 RepID=UPI003D6C6E0C